MRTVTKQYNVYKFNELAKEVQSKVIQDEIENQVQIYCECMLHNDLQEDAERLLEKYFENAKILDVQYDLGYTQGSGAMIEFEIDIDTLNNKYNIFSKKEMGVIKSNNLVSRISVLHNASLYSHEYTFKTDYDSNFMYFDEYDDLENKLYKLIDSSNMHNTSSAFINDIINMNKTLTKDGYDLIESIDEESVLDICNEREYSENGDIYE